MDKLINRSILVYGCLLVYSIILCYAFGFPVTIYGIIATYLIFYVIINISKILFYIAFIINSIVAILYLPQAIIYGRPSMAFVASLFETNLSETKEFILNTPWHLYLYCLLFLCFCVFILFWVSGLKLVKVSIKNKIIACLIIFFSVMYNSIKEFYIKKEFYLVYTDVSIVGFYSETFKKIINYQRHSRGVIVTMNNEPVWDVVESHPKYKNYVLVIGESMRADYLSLYHYPINTTPFLSQTKGMIFDGYIAAALNTQPSLLNTLYFKRGEEIDFQDNIITLANKSGFKTYWISNQGRTGSYDSIAARVAANAKEIFFTKKSSYDTANINDKALINIFKEKLNESYDGHRLFVLHLMGSHMRFCDRLDYPVVVNFINEDMSCYLDSLKQTDTLLKETVSLLENSGDSYSLIYFSDHGLSHKYKDKEYVSLFVGKEYKQNFQVPFVKISSDDTARTLIKVKRSALNFLYGFADWLGIKEKHLLKAGYEHFFSDKPDEHIKVFDGDQFIDFESLADDPPMIK